MREGIGSSQRMKQCSPLASGSFPGLTALWKEERERRLALNMTDDLEPPLTPGNIEFIAGIK